MNKNRKCTDVIFLLAYFAFMIGMVVVGILGFSNGDPAALLFGTDYEGEMCSADYPARYFPNPYELYTASQATHTYGFKDVKSMCLKECPSPVGTDAEPLNWVCNYPDSSDGRGNAGMMMPPYYMNQSGVGPNDGQIHVRGRSPTNDMSAAEAGLVELEAIIGKLEQAGLVQLQR